MHFYSRIYGLYFKLSPSFLLIRPNFALISTLELVIGHLTLLVFLRQIVEEQQQQEQVEEEEDEEFPFNMSDFVTVDEVGDVTDLPGSSGPASLAVPREATPPPELHHPSKVDTNFLLVDFSFI